MSGSYETAPWRPGMPRAPGMTALLARNWWAMMIRGVLAILFGVIALATPVAAIAGLTLLFAAYMLVDGVLAIIAGVRAAAHHERWMVLVLEGVLDLVIAVIAFERPVLTVVVFVLLIGAWAVVTGILLMVAASRLHATHGRWLMALSGLVSTIWGVLLLLDQEVGAVVLTWWLGAYAILFGIALISLSFRLRNRHVARLWPPAPV